MNQASRRPQTVSEYLFSRLADLGVRHIFGVPGDYNLELLDALSDFDGIQWVGNSNELNAGYAADGYARLNGMGVVLTTFGVGELSATNAIAGSHAESVPVFHVVGAPSTTIQQSRLPMHHTLLDGDFEHFARIYGEITCATALLTLDNAAHEIDRVVQACFEEKLPAYLSLPTDLVNAIIEAPRPSPARVPQSDPEQLRSFARHAGDLLAQAESVVLLADHLADRHGARESLNTLVRAGDFACAYLSPGKGLLDESLPQVQGLYIGAHSDPLVKQTVEEADVLIAAGLRLADLSTGGFSHTFPHEGLIELSPHGATIAGSAYEPVVLKDALHTLINIVNDQIESGHKYTQAALRPSSAHSAKEMDAPLTQDVFWQAMEDFLQPDDVLIADVGTSSYGSVTVRLPERVSYISQPLWASIGYALPALLGTQLAVGRERRVVLVTGDGAAQLTIQELGTIISQGLTPVIFVINNDGYTVERAINGPEAQYNSIPRWNWSHIPLALGADSLSSETVTASTPRELEEILTRCADGPRQLTFVEVVLGKHDLPALLQKVAHSVAMQNRAEH